MSAPIPDFPTRYPLATALPHAAPDWRDSPRGGLATTVRLLTRALLWTPS